jgi:MgtC family protein
VGLGAALFSIISAYGYQSVLGGSPDVPVQADISRVAAPIVTGIGFLGGGAILKYGSQRPRSYDGSHALDDSRDRHGHRAWSIADRGGPR